MKKLLLLSLILVSIAASASVFNGKIQSFKQPDESYVEVKLFGTEYYIRAESFDGYTVIRDAVTGYICYAKISEDGRQLQSTGIIYRGKQDLGSSQHTSLNLQKHLDINSKARTLEINKKMQALGGTATNNIFNMSNGSLDVARTPVMNVSGSIKGLTIVVDFSDEPASLPITDFEDFCNGLNYTGFGNNGSLRQYYADISGGLLDYENEVFGYYRAPLTFAAYDAMPYGTGAHQILDLTLNWVDSLGFDFSTLSLNPDSSIMAINLMYTGNPPNWAQGMWHHQGFFGSFTADGVKSGSYNCSPAGSPLQIAVVAHENGHMICKWPDTYKYDNNSGDAGIGAFDLMCWYGSYINPTPPNPLFLNNVGWGKVVDVTNYNGMNTDTANSSTSYIYRNLNDSNEFFLFQNRMRYGRSFYIDDEGLTVWHIDRNGDNQTWHHEVFLEHANNVMANQVGACFHSGAHDEFGDATVPNSAFYNGDPSGLRIWDISSEDTVITYMLGSGVQSAKLHLNFVSLTNDNNSNGFIEPAESADMNVTTFNTGQINSVNAVLTCTPIGATASYVTVNTSPILINQIDTVQTVPATFNISLLPSTPLGTTISLRFSISDGIDSIYITRNFIAGVTIQMSEVTDTICSALFFDAGGVFNYSDNTDFITTFYPLLSTQKLSADFASFNLEYEAGCNYDFLAIFDGPSTASNLLGVFCGTNNPGLITSTDVTGALTFVFHSDGASTDSGWVALLSCSTVTGAFNNLTEKDFKLYPNPTKGVVRFTSPIFPATVSLFDITGKELMQQNFDESSELLFDMSGYAEGMYTLKVQTQNSIVAKKLLLNR